MKMFGVVGHRSMRDIRLLYLTWSERHSGESMSPFVPPSSPSLRRVSLFPQGNLEILMLFY